MAFLSPASETNHPRPRFGVLALVLLGAVVLVIAQWKFTTSSQSDPVDAIATSVPAGSGAIGDGRISEFEPEGRLGNGDGPSLDQGNSPGQAIGDAPVLQSIPPLSEEAADASTDEADAQDDGAFVAPPGDSEPKPSREKAPVVATPTSAAATAPPTTQARPTTTARPPSTTRPPSTAAPAPAPAPSGRVVWEDNFDRLDTSRWALEHSTYGDGNKELQCYRPENVSVANGKLRLRAVTEKVTCPGGKNRNVSSGMVRSRGVGLKPGQAIEFRVKLTPNNSSDQGGLWPAVWSSSWAGGWPRGGELDFLEVMTARSPKRSIYSIHFANPNGSHGNSNKEHFTNDNFSENWRTIRFDYGKGGKLVWYYDGKVVNTITNANTAQGYPAPFNTDVKEIKINFALGGSPGPLSPQAVGSGGATFEVDYIRVFNL